MDFIHLADITMMIYIDSIFCHKIYNLSLEAGQKLCNIFQFLAIFRVNLTRISTRNYVVASCFNFKVVSTDTNFLSLHI